MGVRGWSANQHRARPAIALRANNFRSRQAAIEAQVFGQGDKRSVAADDLLLAIQKKSGRDRALVRLSLAPVLSADSLPNNAESRMADLDALTDEVLARCDALGQISDEPGRLTRTFLSPATRQVHTRLNEWMREAILDVRRDAIGNLIGRRAGATERVFAIGSHIDTVPNAGKFDGTLGVLLGIAAAKAIAGRSFRRTLDVIAFSEEEGVRFRMPYLGSAQFAGPSTLVCCK